MERKKLRGIWTIAGLLMVTGIVGCSQPNVSSENGQQAGTGEESYTWEEITITIPSDWKDKYILTEDENGFFFYQKASYEKMEGMGYLCGFVKDSAWMNYGTGETLLAYTEDDVLYYLMQPTDVPCDVEDEEISTEYFGMAKDISMMAASIEIDVPGIHYDADQYVIPISSIAPVTEETLANLSDNELWIARNEIYARHGKLFENEYLKMYFNACSWYQPKDGANDIDATELSEVEQANLQMIVKMEEIYAKEHPYPKEYETGTPVEVDLWNTKLPPSTIEYEVTPKDEYDYNYILTIDGTAYDLSEYIFMIEPVQDVFYVTDMLENFGDPNYEDGLEIAVLDNGPSEDPVTHFFKYDGTLNYIGEMEGFPFKEQNAGINGFNHQGGVTGRIRMDLIETTYLDGYWWYNSNEQQLEYVESELCRYQSYMAHELYTDLPVYFDMDEASPTITIPGGQQVFFLKSDLKEWILVRGKDGRKGYIHVQDGKVLNVDAPAEEVFSDLYFFD